jgi:hypothetical protein
MSTSSGGVVTGLSATSDKTNPVEVNVDGKMKVADVGTQELLIDIRDNLAAIYELLTLALGGAA